MNFTVEEIYTILDEVKDPEIPTISLRDLGVITNVDVQDGKHVVVTMTPTFTGCPAMDYMKNDVKETLERHGIDSYEVNMTFDEPWSSNKITEKGLQDLKKHGLAPPKRYIDPSELDIITKAECPICNGTNTELRNTFGPTLCRAFHYCFDCKNLFEQFKEI